MKPLTIEQLKSLEVGDWVWVVVLKSDWINKAHNGKYYHIQHCGSLGDKELWCGWQGYCTAFKYSDYGNTWLAYKNKEQAESKGEIVELPCKVGDTIYALIDNEVFDCKVSMVFQKADKTWHFRFSYRKFVTRNPWVENPKYERVTYQHECTIEDFGKEVFTDKAEAERRLAELKGEQI